MSSSKTLDDLINEWEPKLKSAFLDSIYNIRDQAQLDQMVRMLASGDVDGVLRAVGIDPTQFRPFDKALTNIFEAGGDLTAASVPAEVSDGFKTVFNFSVRNPAAETWLRNYSGNMIRSIIEDQQTAIRNFLSAGLEQGANPKTTALDLVGRVSAATGRREGGVIGLTSSQEQWVRAYEAELLSDDPMPALQRTLRDQRFDRAVLKAVKTGEKIPADLVGKMVTTYKNRALRYRAETIARKETITSLHTAQEQAMQQAIAAGSVTQDSVSYIWRTARDARVRDTHRVMNGQKRPMGQMFKTGSGAELRYPGDPAGPAAEVIGCRCWREPKINFLAGIK